MPDTVSMRKKKSSEISPDQLGRLTWAMHRARLVLRRAREERMEAVRQYVGQHWSEEGSRTEVPVNLISLYCSVVGRNLIARNPRVMLSTFDQGLKPTVDAMQAWANKEIERMKLSNTLQRVVLDGLFSVGICKVALATPAEAATRAWGQPAGKPYAERVDLDDFVFDIHARAFEEVSFIGHRYRAPLEVVKDDGKLYSRARKHLTASTDSPYNLEGDERVSTLGRGFYAGDTEEFEDFVDLWEVYLPRHRLVLTLADDSLAGGLEAANAGVDGALREQRWLGPDSGPYHILSYGYVPGNAMPKGPVQDLIDIHKTVNRLYRKLTRQGDRQKELCLVQGGATEDGNRIVQGNDGDAIRVDNPERSVVRSFGGPNQQNFVFADHMKQLFGYMAGNLDMMGGLSPQSKTLGQDQLLSQNASKAVSDMQDATVTFSADVIKALCWYWWHDPFTTMKVFHNLPGMATMSITKHVTPQQRRQGAFTDLDISVDPYSMQHQTPQSRLQTLNQVVQQIVMPATQAMQAQGIQLDLNSYLDKIAEYADMPDLPEIVTIAEPPDPEGESGGGPSQGPSKPPDTTRTYERISRPSGTQAAQHDDLRQQLSAAMPNGTQNGGGQ